MLTNQEIMQKLDEAYKSITISDLGDAIIAPGKFNSFVRAMQAKANVLEEARFIDMQSRIEEIDRVGFVGRILTSGQDAAGDDRVLDTDDDVEPTFATNQLIAVELQAVTGIKDRALRRNIEREGFEDTLITLFGEAAGRDFEEFSLLSDTDIAYADDKVLSKMDGWIKLADNKVYGGGASPDFDTSASDYPENMFEAMLTALPKQYLADKDMWRFYVPWNVENAYRNLLKARGTALGDSATTESMSLKYKGIPVVYSPMVERSADVGDGGNGEVALLSHPDNMAWGLFHEITIERDRVARARRTDFVLTLEGAAGYENEEAAVSAFIDKAE